MSKLPEGYYQGRVVSGEGQFGETSKGTIEAVIPFVLEDDSFEGPERVTVRLYFSEKAEEYSVKKLRAIGWKGGDLTFLDCPNLVTIAVKYEDYNGEERQKCDIALVGGTKPLDPARERAFAAKLAGLVGVTVTSKVLDGLD